MRNSYSKLLLFLFLAIGLLSGNSSFADGSINLYPKDTPIGNRAFLVSSTSFSGTDLASWPFINLGTHYVYAEIGEIITVASSAQGRGGWIRVTKPSGTVLPNITDGQIANRTAEEDGPRVGYTPHEITADEVGVWKVEFASTDGGSGGSKNQVDMSADGNWSQEGGSGLIAAWDVSVRNVADDAWIPGRVFTNVLSFLINGGTISNSNKAFYGITYVLTKDGFIYRVKGNGSNGVGFTFFVNNKGFTKVEDGEKEPTYKSVDKSSGFSANEIIDPRDPDTETDITHKIFYTLPASDLPETASSPEGLMWLRSEPIDPEISNLKVEGAEATEGQIGSKGGNIMFDASLTGRYTINITSSDPEVPFVPIVKTGNAVEGHNSVPWDGKDGSGADLPNGQVPAEIEVVLQGAEVHFPYMDMEINPNGIIIELLDKDELPAEVVKSDIVYWDDSAITGGATNEKSDPEAELTGTSSNSNGHKWGTYAGTAGAGNSGTGLSSYGNAKGMDTWTYILGPAATENTDINVLEADLKIVSITPPADDIVNVGQQLTYTVVVANDGPNDVVGAPFSFTIPDGFSSVSAVFNGNICGGESEVITFEDGVYTSKLDLTNGCEITYTFTVTATSAADFGDIEVAATIMRPNDVYDPDATNSESSAPVDPYEECGVDGCNNILKNAVIFLNTPPVADDDSQTIDQDETVDIDVVTNDGDTDGTVDKTTVQLLDPISGDPAAGNTVTIAGEGTYTVNATTGVVTFDPVPAFAGISAVQYIVSDDEGGVSEPADITITVKPIGNPETDETPIGIAVSTDVRANDGPDDEESDPIGSSLDFGTISDPVHGTAVEDPDNPGHILYTPDADFIGKDTYTYTLTTADGVVSDPVTVTIEVKPVGTVDSDDTPINTAVTIDVKGNDGPSATGTTVTATDGTNGTTTVDATTGEVTYTPDADFIGKDTYTYTLTTADGVVSDPITVTIEVKPVGTADSDDTPINTAVVTDVKDNDGPSATGTTVTATDGTNGTTSVDATTGEVTYTPDADFIGKDTYTYTLTTSDGVESDPITVTIEVKPVGAADEDDTPINTAVTTDVKSNDGASATGTTVTATDGTNGTTTVDATTGAVTYTPDADFIGKDTYTYTLTTADGVESDPVTVTIEVKPVGTADSDDTPINTAVVTDVKDNDGPSATGTTVTATDGTNGTTSVDATTGEVTYTPDADFIGKDTYTYTLTTADGVESDPVTVTIEVKPVGAADEDDTPINTAVTTDVKSNDGASATGTTVTATDGTNGTTTVDATTGAVTYTPDADFIGKDTYTYTLTTADGVESDPVTVTIEVKPVGTADTDDTPINTAVTTDVKGNDGPSATGTTVTATDGTNGTTTVDATTGAVTYTPDADFIGKDTYTYTLTTSDGVESDPITVTIEVKPVGTADEDDTPINTAVTTDVKSNDGASATGTTVTATDGTNGTTTVDATTGAVTYTPDADFIGKDTYTYTLTTADGVVSEAITVTIEVKPVGTADTDDTPINTAVTTDVKSNDGPSATGTTVTATDGTDGTTTVDATTGAVTYTPDADFIGKDTYTYTLTTADGVESDPVTVTIEVKPVGAADTDDTPINTAVTTDVKSNDGASATGTTVTATDGTNGTTTVDATTGAVTYTPDADFIGKDTYTYTLTTADGVESDPVTVTIEVKPVGAADEDDTPINTAVTTDVKSNDGTSATGTTVTATDGTNGTTSVDATTGAVTYTPDADFIGKDTYTYTLTTTDGVESDPITVTIEVKPVGVDDAVTLDANSATTTTVKANDGPSGIETGVNVMTPPTNGETTVNADGTITYVPENDFYGTDSYTYTLTTKDGVVSEPVNVTITVVANPELTLVKSAAHHDVDEDGRVSVNDGIVYTFVVTNTGNVTVSDIALVDDKVTAIGDASIRLAPGESATFSGEYIVNQSDIDLGSVANRATAVGKDPQGVEVTDDSDAGTDPKGEEIDSPETVDSDGDGNDGNDPTVTALPASPDIELIKTFTVDNTSGVTGRVDAGDEVTYTFEVTNTGNVTLTGITLSEDVFSGTGDYELPAGAVFVSSTGSSAVGTLVPGETATYTLTYTLTQQDIDAGTLNNSSRVTGTPPSGTADNVTDESDTATGADGTPVTDPENTDSDEDGDKSNDPTTTQLTRLPRLEVIKEIISEGPYDSTDDAIIYNITVINTGNVTLKKVVLTDDNAVIADGEENVGTLAPGASKTVTVTHAITLADLNKGSVSNQATATGEDPNGDPVTDDSDNPNTPDNPDDATDIDVVQTPELTVRKVITSEGPYDSTDDVITYGITVANTGNVTVDNIVLTDANAVIPTGAENIGTLAPGAHKTITVTHAVTQDDLNNGSVSNQATATGKDPQGNTVTDDSDNPGTPDDPDDATDISVTQQPELIVTKTAREGEHALIGDVITYDITVTNAGNVSVTNIVITDANADAGSIVPATIAMLAPGESRNGTAVHTITQADIDAGYVYNIAKVTGEAPNGEDVSDESHDPDPLDPDVPAGDDCTDCTVTPIKVKPAVALVAVATNTGSGRNGAFIVGDEIEYRFTVTNRGNTTLGSFVLNDMKLGLKDVAVDETLAPGESFVRMFRYTITQEDILAKQVVTSATVGAESPTGTATTDVSGDEVTNDVPTLVPVAEGPESSNDEGETPQNTPVTVNVVANDEEGSSELDPATVRLVDPETGEASEEVTIPGEGTYTVGADGTITFTPIREFYGESTIQYVVRDVNGLQADPATISVAVAQSQPTASNDTQQGSFNGPVQIQLVSNDQPDTAPLDPSTIEIVSQPQHGTLEIGADGIVTYSPNQYYTGPDEFSYRVMDANGNWTNVATVQITVSGFNIPNIITPNGDGQNDRFVIVGLADYDNAEVLIFNRWGNEVYRSRSYKQDWDAQGISEGTYYYLITLRKDGKETVHKGWLVIKRK